MKMITLLAILSLVGCATPSVIPQFVYPEAPSKLLEPSKKLVIIDDTTKNIKAPK